MVLALEPELADLIRETKFRVYNADWLNAVEHGDDRDQVRFKQAQLGTAASWTLQFEEEEGGESAYHSYGSTWAGQEWLWSHGLKFVGDEEED
jgi:hypothetical protein